MAHVEFVLKDEFKELAVAQARGRGFLQTDVQGLHEAGEAQLAQGGLELGHVDGVVFWFGFSSISILSDNLNRTNIITKLILILWLLINFLYYYPNLTEFCSDFT